MWPFSHFGLAHLWAVVWFGFFAALIMAATGVLAALWAHKFDELGAVTNFIVTPLTFLSGTFYLIERLPLYEADAVARGAVKRAMRFRDV